MYFYAYGASLKSGETTWDPDVPILKPPPKPKVKRLITDYFKKVSQPGL